jgi:putative N6-adenine-specific DNA methylase
MKQNNEIQQRFLLVYPPDLINSGAEELETKFQMQYPDHSLEFNKTVSGIEILSDPTLILALIHSLKLPTRVLMRIDQLGICKDYPKLFKKLSKVPWSKYLFNEVPHIKVTCKQSKLIHSDRIKDICIEAFQKSHQHAPFSGKSIKKALADDQKQTIYIRIDQDQVSLSLDLCGDPLFKRGYHPHRFPGSLRENLAAAMAWEILKTNPSINTLLDPFCGGLTLITEFLLFYHWNDSRNFSYQYIPFFKSKIMQVQKLQKNYTQPPMTIKNVIAQDIDPQIIQYHEKNTLKFIHSKIPSVNLTFHHLDSLNIANSHSIDVLISNLPYGKRVPMPNGMKSLEMIHRLKEIYKAKKIVCLGLFPHQSLKNLKKFSNNNLKTSLYIE